MLVNSNKIRARKRVGRVINHPTTLEQWINSHNGMKPISNHKSGSILSIEIKPTISGKEVIINVHIKW